MYDSYLALPDKLLIWFYQNNLFSLKFFLSLLLLPFLSLSPPLFPPLPPSLFSSLSFTLLIMLFLVLTCSFTGRCIFSLSPFSSFLSPLFLSPALLPHPLALSHACSFLHSLLPLAHVLSLSVFLSVCCLGNNDSCILVFFIF